MRPIQWHLKNNWRIPESLEKVIPIPRSLHPHLRWWLEEDNVLTGQPLHLINHALDRRIKRRVGRSLKRTHCQRDLVTARKQAAYKLSGTKSSLSSLKRVSRPLYQQDHSGCNRQHYSSVIHKQRRRHEVGPAVCPTMEDVNLVYQETGDSQSQTHPGPLNVVADKLSRLGQTIQMEWSLLQEVFQAICNRWYQPQIDLFATRFNNKLPLFVSPIPDPLTRAVDALSLSWEDLDAYDFPPTATWAKWWRSYRTPHARGSS